MPYVLEQLQFSIGALRQDWGAERFHDLLDGNILLGKLIFGRAVEITRSDKERMLDRDV